MSKTAECKIGTVVETLQGLLKVALFGLNHYFSFASLSLKRVSILEISSPVGK